MGGLRDLLSLVLGWRSAGPGGDPPYRAVAGQVWHPGAAAGQHDVTGPRAGRVFITGQAAGQIHG